MEEKFRKKFEVFFSLRLIDQVITCCNRYINRPEITFFVIFRAVKSRFSNFENRFWRTEWKKNSGKNLRPFSHSNLPIELVYVAIGALTDLKSRFLWHYRALSHVFRTLKIVFGEGNGGKILKKI